MGPDPYPDIPTRFTPHGAQLWVLRRLQRFSVLVCHRGWGKTTLTVNYLTEQAIGLPDGRFAYLGPLYRQVKQAAWDALKFAAQAPGVEFSESELTAKFPNGSRIQLFGADNYDALRGMHLDGVVLDEYGQIHPAAWSQVIRPAIAIKHGFACFIGTPKGRNQFYDLYRDALSDPEWFTALYRWQDSGVFDTPDMLKEVELARRSMSPEDFAQEYECSFESAVVGAYYAPQFAQARAEGRFRELLWEPTLPVDTWWDLGRTDATAIIMTQTVGREIRCLDYVEARGQDLAYYAKALHAKRYIYGRHHLPHDAGYKTLAGGGVTIEQQLKALGLQHTRVYPRNAPLDGINQARLLWPRVWFDAVKCERLLTCLASYRAAWDDKKKDDKPEPYHDEYSHGADAFRLLAIGHREAESGRHSLSQVERRRPMQREYGTWDPMTERRSGRR